MAATVYWFYDNVVRLMSYSAKKSKRFWYAWIGLLAIAIIDAFKWLFTTTTTADGSAAPPHWSWNLFYLMTLKNQITPPAFNSFTHRILQSITRGQRGIPPSSSEGSTIECCKHLALASLVGLWLLIANTAVCCLNGILRCTVFCGASLLLCLFMGSQAGAQVMPKGSEALSSRNADVRLSVPTLNARVMDQTSTLTASEKTQLTQQLTDIDADFGTQMVVLIVPSTLHESIESYGLRVAQAWRLGRADVGDGLLFVIAKDDRTMRLEVAQALEGTIPDIAAARILDHVVTPAFQRGDFYGGITKAIEAIAKRLDGDETLPAPPASHRATQAFSGVASPPIWEQVKQSPLVQQYYTWLPFYAVLLMLCVLTPLAKPIGRIFGYALMALTVAGFVLLLAYVVRTYKPEWNYAFIERFYHDSLAHIPPLVFDPAFWLLALVSAILLSIYTPFGGMLLKIIGLIFGLGLVALFVGMFGMLIFTVFPFFAAIIGIGLFQNRASLREAWNLYQRKKQGEDIEWSAIQLSLNSSITNSRSRSRSGTGSSGSGRSSSRSGGGGRSRGGGASGRW